MANVKSSPVPKNAPIQDLDTLRYYLQIAIKLEHATFPPYLTALYSIRPNVRKPNFHSILILAEVVREEMLHMTLAANLLNAIGGEPNLLAEDFVPSYPAHLPTGADDFEVGLRRFSLRTVTDTFLKIERPSDPTSVDRKRPGFVKLGDICFVRHSALAAGRKSGRGLLPRVFVPNEKGSDAMLHYWSIGDFYAAIKQGFQDLARKPRVKLFTGDPKRQVVEKDKKNPYYSAGGKLIGVTDLASATDAIDLISGQGEGSGGQIYDEAGEISHYYRFDQILRGEFYRNQSEGIGDLPGKPTGGKLVVHEDEVFPIRTNAKIADYPIGSPLRKQALKFNADYAAVLAEVHKAFNGTPDILLDAITHMKALGGAAQDLMAIRIPGETDHAAPTYEMTETI